MQDILAAAYEQRQRPLCTCKNPHSEMYIAKIAIPKYLQQSDQEAPKNFKYLVKRMPDTGEKHSAECVSYEIPVELSGLGQLSGTAIQENIEDGITSLKFDFSLSKGASRAAPIASGIEQDSVKTDGNKLGLRATLHYLWEQAEFNKWAPAMANKRNWFVVRKYLLEAAKNKIAKGLSLENILYIPESFNLDKKDEITQRRIAALSGLHNSETKGQKLMIMLGEVKEIKEARYDFKVVLKHLPDYHVMLNADIHKRLEKRFDKEIDLWKSNENCHLIIIGTFGAKPSGVASFEEVALMTVNENWIPYDNSDELQLLNSLTRQNKKFIKSLRYNLPSTTPLASAVITTDDNHTTALYISPASANDAFRADLDSLIENSDISSWLWDAGNDAMPSLPN